MWVKRARMKDGSFPETGREAESEFSVLTSDSWNSQGVTSLLTVGPVLSVVVAGLVGRLWLSPTVELCLEVAELPSPIWREIRELLSNCLDTADMASPTVWVMLPVEPFRAWSWSFPNSSPKNPWSFFLRNLCGVVPALALEETVSELATEGRLTSAI